MMLFLYSIPILIVLSILISVNDAFISPLHPPASLTGTSYYDHSKRRSNRGGCYSSRHVLFLEGKDDDDDPPKLTDSVVSNLLLPVANALDDATGGDDPPKLTDSVVSNLLLPVANALDDATGGWALSYADLSPESEETPIGRAFLATNLAYTAMGLFLTYRGEVWLGTITEMASIASFLYHYTQLAKTDAPVVRFALMIDYIVAALCLGTASFYIWLDPSSIPVNGYIACVLAVFFLGLSWVWEKGLPYCINHGLWHLLGGYGGSLIGQAHVIAATTASSQSI